MKNADVVWAISCLAQIEDVEGQEVAHDRALGCVETTE